jgi:hypothetical protein
LSTIQDNANNLKDGAVNYMQLSNNVSSLFVDALASMAQRRLQYVKSVWEIATRPYQSTSVETIVRDNFDRTSQLIDLTADELRTDGNKTAEFTEKLLSYATKLQDAATKALRGVLSTSISSLDYVKDTTQKQFDDLTKRLEEAERRASPVGGNH